MLPESPIYLVDFLRTESKSKLKAGLETATRRTQPIDREFIRRQHRHSDYRAQTRNPIAILADNVDKASNIGGILRVADAFLVETVLANCLEPDVSGAVGAQFWQPVEWGVNLLAEIARYRASGYAVVVLEQSPKAISMFDFEFPRRTLLVVGAEMFGVSDEVLEGADSTVFIPQGGLMKSLNVVTATAIALYEYSRQHWMPDFVQSERHLMPSADSMRIEGPSGRRPDHAG